MKVEKEKNGCKVSCSNGCLMMVLLAFLLIITCSSAQSKTRTYHVNDSISFEVSEFLYTEVDDYFKMSRDYDIDYSRFDNLIGILYIDYMFILKPSNPWALTRWIKYPDNKLTYIYVSSEIPKFLPSFLEAVVYHELFHVYDGPKEPQHPNPESRAPYILRERPNIERTIRLWKDAHRNFYFKYLETLKLQEQY